MPPIRKRPLLIFIGLVVALAATGAFVWRLRPAWLFATATGRRPVVPSAENARVKPTAVSQPPQSKPEHVGRIRFALRAARETGIRFSQFSGNSPEKHFPAANGTGVAMLDYDGDGRQDLYFVTSVPLPLDPARSKPHNELYRNGGGMRFQDVTSASGSGHCGFGQGCTSADFDNDGFPELYLVCFGRNAMYANNGDGTYSDVSRSSASDDLRWGTSCAAIDFDNDGDLDLYVCNYGQWSPDKNPFCGNREKNLRHFCSPRSVTPEQHALFRNEGDWTFRDVLPDLGLARKDGRGQGVVAADLNDDGLTDLYVANDMSPNFVFLNRGGGSMEDFSDLSGASHNSEGQDRAGMGVDAEDVTGDGRPELFVTNFHGEPNSMFRNDGKGFFTEITASAGFRSSGIAMVKWGTRLVDFDHDGWPDAFVTSGHVDDNLVQMGDAASPREEPALLWRNVGGRFELVSDSAGDYFTAPHVGRGASFGDLNDDGDIDVIVNEMDHEPAILINDSTNAARTRGERPNAWLRLLLSGRRSNRNAIGARVIVDANGTILHRQIKGGSSYSSAHDLRLTIGVGKADTVTRVTIRWPSGETTELRDVSTGSDYGMAEP